MKTLLKILGTIAIIIGVVCVLAGVASGMDSYPTNPISSINAVLGGGLFMALGIAIFQLNKNKQ